jgi:hypothetical protein
MSSPAHARIGSRSQSWRPIVVAMALCALVLRLAVPAPAPTLVDPEIGLVALFGEHALCLSGATRAGQDEAPSKPTSPARGQHDNHHAGWCCHWHATSAIVPPTAAAAVLVFFAVAVDRIAVAAIAPPARPGGPAQPRAPPTQS